MNILKKIFTSILNILMAIVFVILLIVIYSVIQINLFHKDYVNLFGYTFFQVKSGSMETAIKIDDILIEKVIDSNYELQVGDIVSFKEDSSVITHRIVKIEENTITTKGDANNSEDDSINRNEIFGKVVKIIPNVSIWINVFKTKSVYSMLIITFVLFIITFSIGTDSNEKSEVQKQVKENEKSKTQKQAKENEKSKTQKQVKENEKLKANIELEENTKTEEKVENINDKKKEE